MKNTSFSINMPEISPELSDYSPEELLSICLNSGMLKQAEIIHTIQMETNKKYLEAHKYNIFYSKSKNAYITTVSDSQASGGRRQIKRRNLEDLHKALVDYYKATDIDKQKKQITVKEAMTEAINHHFKGIEKASSRERYTQDMNRFFSNIFDRAILTMNEYDWECYLEDMVVDMHPKRKAFMNACTVVRLTLKNLSRQGLTDINARKIFDDLDIDGDGFDTTKKDDEEEVFSPEEHKKLVGYLWDHRTDPECLMLLLMAFTGLRVGEATTIKHSDIEDYVVSVNRSASGYYRDDDGKSVQFRVKSDGKAKTTNSIRKIIIPPGGDIILDEIKELNPDSEFVFLNSKGQVFSRHAIEHKLERICKKLDIVPKSPHKLRKTYASILDEGGLEEAAITSLVGHTNFKTTKTHYVRNRNRAENFRERLSKVNDLNCREIVSSQAK